MTLRRARQLLGAALVLAAVGGLLPWAGPAGVLLLISLALPVAVAGSGVRTMLGQRDPRPPSAPRRPLARPAEIGPEPPRQVNEPSDSCTICGRPLTNQQSRIARVGTECIQRHGPRYKLVTNPAHDVWIDRMMRARTDAIAEKVALDRAFSQQQATFAELLDAHRRELEGPGGTARRERRRQARSSVALAAASVPAQILLVALASGT